MFAKRARWLLIVAVVLGLVVSVLGILLQGATAAGVSLWASLKSTILESTLESRFGKVWGLRAIDWLALGALIATAAALARAARTKPGEGVSAEANPDASVRPRPWLLALIGSGRRLSRCHAGALRPCERSEPDRGLLPLRRPARARRERLGRRDRLPAVRAAGRDPAARAFTTKPPAAGDARALLAHRAGRRGHIAITGRGAGVYRRAQPARPLPQHLRRADHRQDRPAAPPDLPRLDQSRTGDPCASGGSSPQARAPRAPASWLAARCEASSR